MGTAAARSVGFALPPLTLAAIAFYPIVGNYFYQDDFISLYDIAEKGGLRFVLQPAAGHLLVVRNAVFWALATTVGPNPAPYFATVLLTHLLNVYLLFQVLRTALESDRLACVGATLWGTSPVLEGTLGWYAVYGQVLATTLVLAVLWDSIRPGPVTSRRALGWSLLLLLAATSFGVAVGVALAFPAVVGLLRPGAYARRSARWVLLALPMAVVALYLGLHALHAALYGNLRTDATPYLAPLRGWRPISLLLPHLVGAGLTGLYLGFSWTPFGYAGQTGIIVPAVVAAGAVGALAAGSATTRRQLLAFLLLALACYGPVAAGRSLYLPLGHRADFLATSPRWHYTGSAALTLVVCTVLGWLGARIRLAPLWKDVLAGAWLVATAVLYARSGWQIDHHAAARAETGAVLAGIRSYAERAPAAQPIILENQPFRGVTVVPAPMFPGWVAVFMIFFPRNQVDGHPVSFGSGDPNALAAGIPGGRLGTLLVARTGWSR